jgi:hypothetical protein
MYHIEVPNSFLARQFNGQFSLVWILEGKKSKPVLNLVGLV